MKNTNDTRTEERAALLTAYALGETDAAQTSEVEVLLAMDDTARGEVEEIRATAALLASGFAQETPERLPETVRAAVTAAAAVTGAAGEPAASGRGRRLWPLVGMAASIAAGVGLAGWLDTPRSPQALTMASGRDLSSPLWRRDGLESSVAEAGAGAGAAGASVGDADASAEYALDLTEERLGPRPADAPHVGVVFGTRDEPVATDSSVVALVAANGKPLEPAEGTSWAFGAAIGHPVENPDGETTLVWHRSQTDEVEPLVERLRRELRLRYGSPGREDYAHPGESTFRVPMDEPLSTFSVDVDTASYANVRRFLNSGQLPPPAAVRVEEMVNYFRYSDPAPVGPRPIAATLESATCPWNTRNRIVRIGIRAKMLDGPPPPANLVFLIDVSGSMQPADKLPLLQRAMKMLAGQMREQDRVAIVTYASNSGVRLASTTGADKDAIQGAIDGLSAGGSTNGGAGIVDAYRIAQEHFVRGGINRVILATDGDFNVGVTDRGELTTLIEEKAEGGVFLSVLGVGTGNLKDATLESLADRGNGNYHYLDGLREARKVLVDELLGTIVTVAKDVKIQVEFNPAVVGAYRLIGYENRVLAAADFNDDAKDAGEMGAGGAVTALYEIVPAGAAPQPGVDPLRYQGAPTAVPSAVPSTGPSTEPVAEPSTENVDDGRSGEMLMLKVRYKLPEGTESARFEMPLTDSGAAFDEASADLRFASAVASFGMLLRGSPAAAGTNYDAVLELAQGAIDGGGDPGGHRAQFLDLVLKAKTLSGR